MTRVAVIVMGVSGSGKTTLGNALAAQLGWRFIEGDTLHPPENVAKMRGGSPLDDADRAPWIARVIETIQTRGETGVVVACSALRREHRGQIRAHAGPVVFVLPVVDRALLAPRIRNREPHFMPLSLLDSQLGDFEPPTPEELVLRLDGGLTIEQQVQAVQSVLQARLE